MCRPRKAAEGQPMSTFTIDNDNNITTHASSQEATLVDGAGGTQFNSEATLANVSSDWPMSRLVDIWNSISGNTVVKKFQDRKKAVARIWKAIQRLAPDGESSEQEMRKSKGGRKAVKKVTASKKSRAAKKAAGK